MALTQATCPKCGGAAKSLNGQVLFYNDRGQPVPACPKCGWRKAPAVVSTPAAKRPTVAAAPAPKPAVTYWQAPRFEVNRGYAGTDIRYYPATTRTAADKLAEFPRCLLFKDGAKVTVHDWAGIAYPVVGGFIPPEAEDGVYFWNNAPWVCCEEVEVRYVSFASYEGVANRPCYHHFVGLRTPSGELVPDVHGGSFKKRHFVVRPLERGANPGLPIVEVSGVRSGSWWNKLERAGWIEKNLQLGLEPGLVARLDHLDRARLIVRRLSDQAEYLVTIEVAGMEPYEVECQLGTAMQWAVNTPTTWISKVGEVTWVLGYMPAAGAPDPRLPKLGAKIRETPLTLGPCEAKKLQETGGRYYCDNYAGMVHFMCPHGCVVAFWSGEPGNWRKEFGCQQRVPACQFGCEAGMVELGAVTTRSFRDNLERCGAGLDGIVAIEAIDAVVAERRVKIAGCTEIRPGSKHGLYVTPEGSETPGVWILDEDSGSLEFHPAPYRVGSFNGCLVDATGRLLPGLERELVGVRPDLFQVVKRYPKHIDFYMESNELAKVLAGI